MVDRSFRIFVSIVALFALTHCGSESFIPTAPDLGNQTGAGPDDTSHLNGGEGNGANPGSPNNPGNPNTPKPPTYVRETVTDLFRAEYLQKQDFLFVIDNSRSMSEEINSVKDHVEDFMTALSARRFVDFQVAVTTTDARYRKGGLVSSSTGIDIVNINSAAGEWESIISKVGDSNGSFSTWNEMGFLSAKLAIEVNGPRFMRPNVPLALVILSDEDDHSCWQLDSSGSCPGAASVGVTELEKSVNAINTPVEDYVNYFKGLSTSTTIFPIAGLTNAQGKKKCSDIYQIGSRYLNFSNLFGGNHLGSICKDDLVDDFVQVAEVLSARGICFKLTNTPEVPITEVSVGSTVIVADAATGYSFDAPSNSICFADGDLVDDGQGISVTYDTLKLVP